MDKWSKKKATETCGGAGMGKFIDYNETRRLSRLKNIKSSIGSNMSHNGWQKQQIEKRRKEQLRQRKKAAKKKPLGDGIQVDTKICKSDAVSKCGLKLPSSKVNPGDAANTAREKPKPLAPQRRAPQNDETAVRSNHRRCGPRQRAHKNESSLPLLGGRSDVSDGKRYGPSKRKVVQKQKGPSKIDPKPRFQVDDGKENSDNSANRDTGRCPVPQKKGTSSKKYFDGLNSLKSLQREHADAIKMLEELDKCEGNRRRSLDSDNSVDSTYSSSSRNYASTHKYQHSNTLDDEFVRDCSKIETNQAQKSHNVTDSFLNMTHLSIHLTDNFDDESHNCNGGGDAGGFSTHTPTKKDGPGLNLSPVKNLSPTKDRSFTSSFDDYDDDMIGNNTPPHTPLKNRSFTSSCASLEDEDFFGDADVDSDDGYSSGTF